MDKGGIVQMAKLVAFYSRADENYFGGSMKYIQIGNTEKAAKMIADMTGADLFKIEQKIPYAADYNTCIAQAKEDISEDGYWGVNQTSDRLLDFAVALSGGDEENMKKMVSAVEKGFKEATKSWGKDLPSISNDTYSATMKKFDQWFSDNGYSTKTSDILGNN